MKNTFVILWLIAMPYLLLGQDFQAGTIVFGEGDSLDCEYQAQFSWKEEPFLLYQDPSSNQLKRIPASELIAFGNLEEGYWHISRQLAMEIDRKVETRWLFLQSILLGRVSLYKVKDDKFTEHFYIENSSGEIAELINRSYQELDAARITRTRFDYAYLPTLQKSLMGCMELVKNVNDYAFTEGALTQAVIDYHHCLEAPYQKMISPPSPFQWPQIGLKAAYTTPFASSLPTANGNRNGWEAGLSIRWQIPKTHGRFALQIDGIYHRALRLAQVSDQAFLAPFNTFRISPILQHQFHWSDHSVFYNVGYDWILFGQNDALSYPDFREVGYLRWESNPKLFFGSLGYIYHAKNGHLFQFESRIRFRQFMMISLGTSFYW
ncbi:MAG: hypothetical protein AAF927_11115 [Bacteroidota bacterium]